MTITATGRAGMVAYGNLLDAHPTLVDYSEGTQRMMMETLTGAQAQVDLAKGAHLTGDCSGTYSGVAKWSGCTDPNGMSFDGYGYTGTELSNMPHIALSAGLPGDAIVFGVYPGAHVAYILEPDPTNPILFSHGSEAGPYRISLEDEWKNHPGAPITVCSLAPFLPKAPPAPPDPNHDRWFDTTVIKNMPRPTAGGDTEQKVVEAYDKRRLHPKDNASELAWLELNLEFLVTRLTNNMKAQGIGPVRLERAWRLVQLKDRAAGNQVVK